MSAFFLFPVFFGLTFLSFLLNGDTCKHAPPARLLARSHCTPDDDIYARPKRMPGMLLTKRFILVLASHASHSPYTRPASAHNSLEFRYNYEQLKLAAGQAVRCCLAPAIQNSEQTTRVNGKELKMIEDDRRL